MLIEFNNTVDDQKSWSDDYKNQNCQCDERFDGVCKESQEEDANSTKVLKEWSKFLGDEHFWSNEEITTW